MPDPKRSPFEALSIIEGVYFSQRLDVLHGWTILPVNDGRFRAGFAVAVDDMLESAGWSARLGPDWVAGQARNVPAFVLHAGLPGGHPIEQLADAADATAGLLADIVTLHRGAAANVVLTIVEEVGSSERPRPHAIRTSANAYHGNLLAGSLSGEDATVIGGDVNDAIKGQPLSMLWLRMAQEARAERNPDFAVFRWWSLLETIAGQGTGGDPMPVTDFDGTPILKDDGKPVLTSTSRGAVFELIKRYFADRNISSTSYVMHPPFETLWETMWAWCGLRDAVAHYGRFDPASPDQQSRWWFRYVSAARQHELSIQGQPASMLQSIRELAAYIVRWAIRRL